MILTPHILTTLAGSYLPPPEDLAHYLLRHRYTHRIRATSSGRDYMHHHGRSTGRTRGDGPLGSSGASAVGLLGGHCDGRRSSQTSSV